MLQELWADFGANVLGALAQAFDEAVIAATLEVGLTSVPGGVIGVKGQVMQLVNKELRSITQTTIDEVDRLAQVARTEDWSRARFLAELDTLTEARVATRAEMVATTELVDATAVAREAVFAQAPTVVGKRWTVVDPCPICADNADVEVNLGEEFPSGHQRPTAHPNCQCEIEPVFDANQGRE